MTAFHVLIFVHTTSMMNQLKIALKVLIFIVTLLREFQLTTPSEIKNTNKSNSSKTHQSTQSTPIVERGRQRRSACNTTHTDDKLNKINTSCNNDFKKRTTFEDNRNYIIPLK